MILKITARQDMAAQTVFATRIDRTLVSFTCKFMYFSCAAVGTRAMMEIKSLG